MFFRKRLATKATKTRGGQRRPPYRIFSEQRPINETALTMLPADSAISA